MNFLYIGSGFSVRRILYGLNVGISVGKANKEAIDAFTLERQGLPVERVGIYSGLVVAVAITVFGIMNYTSIKTETAVVVAPPPLVVITPDIVQTPEEEVVEMKDEETLTEAEKVLASIIPELKKLDEPILTPPLPSVSSRYIFMVDKTKSKFFVLEDVGDHYKVLESFNSALGSKRGDKLVEGDNKTPEGVYQIVEIKKGSDLPAQYGPRAFVLNYPNELDKELGKTGSGIWIHGSGLGGGVAPTEGCVEVNDFHIVEIEKYIALGTQIYIFPEGFEVPVRGGIVKKEVIEPTLIYGLKNWLKRVADSDGAGDSGSSS